MHQNLTKQRSKIMLASFLLAGGILSAGDYGTKAPTEPRAITGPLYIGIGGTLDRVKSQLFGPDMAAGMQLRLGYEFNRNFALELRAAKGLKTFNNLMMDYSYGLYAKGTLPLNESLSVYGLAGYSRTKIKHINQSRRVNTTEQGSFSFGLGTEYRIDANWSVYAEAIHRIKKSTKKPAGTYAINVNSIAAGVLYRF